MNMCDNQINKRPWKWQTIWSRPWLWRYPGLILPKNSYFEIYIFKTVAWIKNFYNYDSPKVGFLRPKKVLGPKNTKNWFSQNTWILWFVRTLGVVSTSNQKKAPAHCVLLADILWMNYCRYHFHLNTPCPPKTRKFVFWQYLSLYLAKFKK